ncbi:MAG: hypothetical protein ACO38G_09840, partial [Burkholderiaceae bacterium]
EQSEVVANVKKVTKPKGATSIGGLVVRNVVKGGANAYVMNVNANVGSMSVLASDNAVIKAMLKASAEVHTEGKGLSLAVGGVISTNVVLGGADAYIKDSQVVANLGDVKVEALNSAHIVANNNSSVTSTGISVGVTLAFNTVGWADQNVLFNAIDTLVGSSIGEEDSVEAYAHVENSDIFAQGSVLVLATDESYIKARITNETGSSTSAAASKGADDSTPASSSSGSTSSNKSPGASAAAKKATASNAGASVGVVLSSNRVSANAHATIIGSGRSVQTLDGDLEVKASDDARIIANSNLAAEAAAESDASLAIKAIINAVGISFTDRSGSQKLTLGDRVMLADAKYTSNDFAFTLNKGDRVNILMGMGDKAESFTQGVDMVQGFVGGEAVAGSCYEYIGDATTDVRLDEQDFSDPTKWKLVNGKAGSTYVLIGKGGSSDLSKEDYTDKTRWLQLNLEALAEAGSAVADALLGGSGGAGFGGLV